MPGEGGFFKYEGKIFRLNGKKTDNKGGTDAKVYTVVNVITGKIVVITTEHPSQAYEILKRT
jgi:hypothetical protein